MSDAQYKRTSDKKSRHPKGQWSKNSAMATIRVTVWTPSPTVEELNAVNLTHLAY